MRPSRHEHILDSIIGQRAYKFWDIALYNFDTKRIEKLSFVFWYLSISFSDIEIPDKLIVVFSLCVIGMFDFVHEMWKWEIVILGVVVKSSLEDGLKLLEFIFYLWFYLILLLLWGYCYKRYFFDLVNCWGVDHEYWLWLGDEDEDGMVFDELDA